MSPPGAISRARAAFVINTTVSSHKWRERQLYGLSRLIALHRKELVQALCDGCQDLGAKYEEEIVIILQDVAQHYIITKKRPIVSRGASTEQTLPVGVTLLLIDSANPIRFLFGSLAANLALGNAVILANNAQRANKFWLVIQREAPKYLDPEAIQVLLTLDSDRTLFEEVDLISIFAETPEPYNDILQLPHARFIDIKGGSSLLMVDEGDKSHDKIAMDIAQSYRFHGLRPEAINAVFLQEAEIDKFQKSFSAIACPSIRRPSTNQLDKVAGFARFTSFSYSVELASLVGAGKRAFGVAEAIEAANKSGILLVVVYRSIDHVIDALRRLKPAPTYLTLLAPRDTAKLEYFQRWTTSRFFSLGSIRPVFSYDYKSEVLFSQAMFGKVQISFMARPLQVPKSLDEAICEVHRLVKAPQEAPNQTVDFFVYMNRVAIGTGMVLGTLSLIGLYLKFDARKAI